MKATIAGATMMAVLAGPAAAVAAPENDLRGRLDAVVAAGAVGALAEVRDEHGVWRGVSGAAVRGSGRPVPVDGRFRVGSVTKTFVATVVLQLVAEGRVRLGDVRSLLDHTSGVPDYLDTLTLPPEPAAWSYATEDRRRQATIALTPDFTGDVDAAVDAFLDRVFCGT